MSGARLSHGALSIPVIDIAPFRTGLPAARAAVAAAVDQAASEVGFIQVVGRDDDGDPLRVQLGEVIPE